MESKDSRDAPLPLPLLATWLFTNVIVFLVTNLCDYSVDCASFNIL